ncbi:HEXXH motif-containing protein [Cognatiyoonia sediminum]|uniref:HEXXH motif-containing protein n=1 Tax=Cognatiyoonia sediminum TaxID=1508389 RepID=A0A1M5QSI1_9RHOB|nr:HEXXH motif-containing putative peptide modification protein [Cognatiyoonia sediminum]SHH16861.1 HEXXH motif-containing protein [Cognatiyoonia sediminum]
MSNYVLPNLKWITDVRATLVERIVLSLDHLIFEANPKQYRGALDRETLQRTLVGPGDFPSASIFAANSALIEAALSNAASQFDDRLEQLERISATTGGAPQSLNVIAFSDIALDPDELVLLQRAYADDVGLTVSLVAPSEEEVSQATAQIQDALDLIGSSSMPWKQEILALAPQIYLASPSAVATRTFGGAAVFDAFGSVLMNPDQFESTEQIALSLVHETSHLQMFLFHLDDPVVLNDEKAAYSSPLRQQPRPMEGIFHAMWVSARMVAAGIDILDGNSSKLDREKLQSIIDDSANAYRDCAVTVSKEGKLSLLGEELFASADSIVNG